MKPMLSVLLLLMGVFSLGSCSFLEPVGATLKMDTALFVRVPGDKPPPGELRNEPADGWHFKPVLQGARNPSPEPGEKGQLRGNWYLVYHDRDMNRNATSSWFSQWRGRKRAQRHMGDIAQATYARFQVYPQVVEPNLIFKPQAPRADPPQDTSSPHDRLEVAGKLKDMWPAGTSPLWHEELTRMREAREVVERSGGHGGIRIGFLDNGFERSHAAFPKHGEAYRSADRTKADAIGQLACAVDGCGAVVPTTEGAQVSHRAQHPNHCGAVVPTTEGAQGHGTGTVGILAGKEMSVVDKSGREVARIGGAVPDAQVVPVRIAYWVASVATASMAYGIDYASRVEGCDVVSMSHGGVPSLMWMDAVNAAYDRGTVVIGAAANYGNLTPLDLGAIIPSTTLYPAACRRVLGVSGVTASGRSFGLADWRAIGWRILLPSNWALMRGCSGPDGKFRSLNPFNKSWESIDKKQRDELGILRTHQISAPTPNVPWIDAPTAKRPKTNLISLDGGGTSSATPQVAGAAALWLAKNEPQIRKAGQWQSWQKAEATIQALLLSAHRENAGNPDNPGPDARCRIGAGVLDARAALEHDFKSICARRDPNLTLRFPSKPNGAPMDTYDSSRSLNNTLFPGDDHTSDLAATLDLHQSYSDPKELKAALDTLYYNESLLAQWRNGAMPLTKREWSTMRKPVNWVLHPWSSVRRLFYQYHEPRIRAVADRRAKEAIAKMNAPKP